MRKYFCIIFTLLPVPQVLGDSMASIKYIRRFDAIIVHSALAGERDRYGMHGNAINKI